MLTTHEKKGQVTTGPSSVAFATSRTGRLFSPGQISVSPATLRAARDCDPRVLDDYVRRHLHGFAGCVTDNREASNHLALEHGAGDVVSAYVMDRGTIVIVRTIVCKGDFVKTKIKLLSERGVPSNWVHSEVIGRQT